AVRRDQIDLEPALASAATAVSYELGHARLQSPPSSFQSLAQRLVVALLLIVEGVFRRVLDPLAAASVRIGERPTAGLVDFRRLVPGRRVRPRGIDGCQPPALVIEQRTIVD